MKTKQSLVGKLFSGGGWAVFTMFVYELLEEALECIIALVITNVLVMFATKVLVVMTITQGIKVGLKRFLYPYIKTLTYKEGNDKMKLLKNYWIKVWGNKITGTLAGVGFGGIAYFALQPFITKLWLLAVCVAVTFVVAYNIAIFFGGESLAQIEQRLADALLNKEQKKVIKEAKKRISDAVRTANQTQVEKEKEAEKAKATAEFEEKVKNAMADLQAKAQTTKNS